LISEIENKGLFTYIWKDNDPNSDQYQVQRYEMLCYVIILLFPTHKQKLKCTSTKWQKEVRGNTLIERTHSVRNCSPTHWVTAPLFFLFCSHCDSPVTTIILFSYPFAPPVILLSCFHSNNLLFYLCTYSLFLLLIYYLVGLNKTWKVIFCINNTSLTLHCFVSISVKFMGPLCSPPVFVVNIVLSLLHLIHFACTIHIFFYIIYA
jgi:hypothetical protein